MNPAIYLVFPIVRDVENRKRIQDLLALTKPVSQEITYFRDTKPKIVSKTSGTTASKKSSSNIIRTIYLPNNKSVEHLETIAGSLKTRLTETVKNVWFTLENLTIL
jgi:hypothetical protein